MAPLPENSTPRFKLHYVITSYDHTMQVRSHMSPASFGTLMGSFLAAFGINIYALTVTNVEFAAANSNIFNLVTTGIEGITYGAGASDPQHAPLAYNFIGRSTGGRRVRLAVFGSKSYGTNYRVSPGEESWVDDARVVLDDAGPAIVCIDDIPPIWKTYVNVKPFDHWINQVR